MKNIFSALALMSLLVIPSWSLQGAPACAAYAFELGAKACCENHGGVCDCNDYNQSICCDGMVEENCECS